MKIRIIKCTDANWYHKKEEYVVSSRQRYIEYGLEVNRKAGQKPNLIMHGDYETIADPKH